MNAIRIAIADLLLALANLIRPAAVTTQGGGGPGTTDK